MADVSEAAVSQDTTTPKKGAKKAARAKANHPTTAVMVNSAIKSLKERGGSSLQAIKKYVASTYKVDAEKLAPFIKKFLKTSVASGALVQTKGKGASGSFKLATTVVPKKTAAPVKKKSKPVPKKVQPVKTPPRRDPRARKVPKRAAPKKPTPTPAPAKKTAKTPVKKAKAPKAKTVKKSPAKAKRATPKRK